MKRYDSMGFESEHGIWVRAVDADERIRALEAELAQWRNGSAQVNGKLLARIQMLEAALWNIALICAEAPPCDELNDEGKTYGIIVDSILRHAKCGSETPMSSDTEMAKLRDEFLERQ